MMKQRRIVVWILTLATTTVLAQASSNAQTAFADLTVQSLISTSDTPNGQGSARIAITEGSEDIQVSNFNFNSFIIENKGDKRIAAVFIDVTNAIFDDSVFDSDGRGGDHVSKELTLDSGTETGPISIDQYPHHWLPARNAAFNAASSFDPTSLSNVNNLFVDEVAENSVDTPKAGGGFRGQLMLYTDFSVGKQLSLIHI